jgi:hypothetical protein
MQSVDVSRALAEDGVVFQNQVGPFCDSGPRERGERVLSDTLGELRLLGEGH